MRQRFCKPSFLRAACLLLLNSTLQADKLWNNNTNITEPSTFAPVVNENLFVNGLNRLAGHIHIAAISTDVVISVTGSDSVISTTDFSAAAQLHLFADAGRTITFDITSDLMFRGSSRDFLISFSGAGNVIFNVAGDQTVSFSSVSGERGAIFLINADNFTHTPQDFSVLFSRFHFGALGVTEPNLNATVGVGPLSMISFIAPAGSTLQRATLAFDPSTSTDYVGRLILAIQNGAAFNIQAHTNFAGTGEGFGDITLADINLSSAEGDANTATVNIINRNGTTAWSGLLVVNNNTEWVQLRSNPWCEAVVSTTPVGFVLGETGLVALNDNTYLDYVGTVTNYSYNPVVLPEILELRELEGIPPFNYVKDRNPSAFIVDGSNDPFANPRAQIILDGKSAIYFRSGVDRDGVSTFTVFDPLVGDAVISFTISPADTEHGPAGYGEIVFDVEGALDVIGSQINPNGENVLNILSLAVSPTGGSVFIESPEVTFSRRTFQRDEDGNYLHYNSACFLINNRLNLLYASLQHTDTLHFIYDKNFPLQSEASYIGGESWKLCEDRPRPNIVFLNSQLLLHTSAAVTGLDFFVPEYLLGNSSAFKFYYNGRYRDQGTGRELVMGTNIGALASDLNTIINRDAHLDIFQEFAQASPQDQILNFIVAPNNNKVVEGLPANGLELLNQFSVQTLFLGHASNISIGTNASVGTDPISSTTFLLTTTPTLFINGDFFSFQTQGGETNLPEMSMTSGEGGMFVDRNGLVQINTNRRASVGMMVSKTRNGSIDLPKRQVFFAPRVGIAHWRLDLTDPEQRELVAAGVTLSDFTLDWAHTIKDYSSSPTSTSDFIPYEPADTPAACMAPNIINQNLVGLPVIRGTIDQFQIKNSRLGDQAHLLIDGGNVRELVMLTGNSSADAPVGVIVLQDNADLGLGTAHRNIDSDDAQVVLGLNGIILVANGDCQVLLNQDVLINNVCPTLTGTSFGQTSKQELFFTSPVPREIRITNQGVWDLSAFATPNQEVVIGGEINLVMEPGARLILGGGKLRIAENAKLSFQPFLESNPTPGVTLASTDLFRAKITGSGNFIFSENAQIILPRGAYVGVESAGIIIVEDQIGFGQLPQLVQNCSYIASQTWTMRDSASLFIGSDTDFGGSLQIGNTLDLTGSGARVDWFLEMNGAGVLVDVNSQGMLGLGVGIVNKPEDVINTWLVDRTFNVGSIGIKMTQGTLRASQIFPTSNKLAGLVAIGNSVGSCTFTYDPINVDILGGNPFAFIMGGPVTPMVETEDGVSNTNLIAGILASTPLLSDPSKSALYSNPFSPAQLYNFLKMNEYAAQVTKLATIAQTSLGSPTSGYIDRGLIVRNEGFRIQGFNTVVDPLRSVEQGAVGIALDNSPQRTPTYYEVVL